MKLKSKRKLIKIFSLLLCFFVVFTSVPSFSYTVNAESLEEKLGRLEKEKLELQKEIDQSANNVKKAQQTKTSYAKKAEVERQQLEALAEQIAQQESALVVKQDEIATKIGEIETTQQLFEDRMVSIYKKKERSTLSVLLSVSDFGEFLRVSKNLQTIAKHDTEMIDMLKQQRAELEQMRAEIEIMIADLNAQREERERIKAEYENSMVKAQQQADAAAAAKKASETAYEQTDEEYEATLKEWLDFVGGDLQGGDYIGGVFIWPVPTHKRISSGFGIKRIINGRPDTHRGIDIPAPAGTPIYAAGSGILSMKAQHWTYGKCLKISHGGGVVSVYAHMSAFAADVYDGMPVTQGKLIGYVGSTGNSTGNHLHFEVDEYANPVNPDKYLKG